MSKLRRLRFCAHHGMEVGVYDDATDEWLKEIDEYQPVYLAADVDALLAEIRAAVDRARKWEVADCDCAACAMFRAIYALVGSP